MRFRTRFYRILIFSAFFAVGFPGCRTARRTGIANGLVLTSNLELRSYVKFAVGANGNKDTRLHFPLLQIYDAAGRLVYVGHDARANATALEQMPGNIDTMHPISGSSLLPDVMRQLPEFEVKREDLLRAKRTTALSVFLQDCHACSIQEEALDKTQTKLHDRGVNLLIIKVARPVVNPGG